MAKISLIAPHLNAQVLAVAQGLHQQRHEIMIITSSSETVPNGFDFQILTYFKKWNWLEAVRLIPLLLRNFPDVFHFFFDNDSLSPSSAHWVIASLASNLKRAVVTTLGSSKIDTKAWRRNPFLKLNRAVIAPSREKLMYLRRQRLMNPQSVSEVVLPFPEKPSAQEDTSEDSLNLLRRWQPFVVVPAHPERKAVDELFKVLEPSGFRLVFLGERSSGLFNDLRCLAFGTLSESRLQQLVNMSSAVLLAFHQYEPVELMRWQKQAREFKKPLIVHTRQLELLPGLCLQGKSGFVLDNLREDFHRLLQNHPKLEIAKYESPSDTSTPADHSLNEISRIYVRALASPISK